MNPRTAERKAAEWKRVYGSEERVEWISRQPSVVSGKTPCQNAHIKSGGMGRKADSCWIVALTAEEHAEIHNQGIRSFEAKYGIDLTAAAVATEMKWRAYNGDF